MSEYTPPPGNPNVALSYDYPDHAVLTLQAQFEAARWMSALDEAEARQWEGWPWGVFWPVKLKRGDTFDAP